MSDSKVRVFTVTAEPLHDDHNAMSPAFLEHLLTQVPYRIKVEGGDHPCNCHEGEG